LSPKECTDIDMNLVRGVNCRNGTMLPDGTWCDYCEGRLRNHTCPGEVSLQGQPRHDVLGNPRGPRGRNRVDLRRGLAKRQVVQMQLRCELDYAQPALVDCQGAQAETLDEKPLGALAWLKSRPSTDAMASWREQRRRAPTSGPSTPVVPYALLESFFPGARRLLGWSRFNNDHLCCSWRSFRIAARCLQLLGDSLNGRRARSDQPLVPVD
jgi:hypothetical protein